MSCLSSSGYQGVTECLSSHQTCPLVWGKCFSVHVSPSLFEWWYILILTTLNSLITQSFSDNCFRLIFCLDFDFFFYLKYLVAQLVKNPPAMQETPVRFLGWEDPLEKGMATHSSILTWRIPWTIWSMVLQSQTWVSDFHFTSSNLGWGNEGNNSGSSFSSVP